MKLNVMQDLSEIIPYNIENMHLYVMRRGMERYDYRTIYHWHEDLELTYIISGGLDYYVNGEKVVLHPGEGLVTNSGQMHYGDARNYSDNGEICEYICAVFRPELLQADHAMYEKYVRPLIRNERVPYIFFEKTENAEISDFGRLMFELSEIQKQGKPAYEMALLGKLYEIWGDVYSRSADGLGVDSGEVTDELLEKRMVAYIYENYAQPLTLDNIAASANISRSKCCQIFRDLLQQSPVDFLNTYRLTVSRYYVENTEMRFAEISERCGFRGQSYFAQRFRETYGSSPREMRQSVKNRGEKTEPAE